LGFRILHFNDYTDDAHREPRAVNEGHMSKRILVIEDHEENRRLLRDLLTSVGYELIEAVTGEEGLASAETERPDLILMDIQLPGIDGSRSRGG
jgi:CheY-like chemotaxis protein